MVSQSQQHNVIHHHDNRSSLHCCSVQTQPACLQVETSAVVDMSCYTSSAFTDLNWIEIAKVLAGCAVWGYCSSPHHNDCAALLVVEVVVTGTYLMLPTKDAWESMPHKHLHHVYDEHWSQVLKIPPKGTQCRKHMMSAVFLCCLLRVLVHSFHQGTSPAP